MTHQELNSDEQSDQSFQPIESLEQFEQNSETGLRMTVSKACGIIGFSFVLSWIYLVLMGNMLLSKTGAGVDVAAAAICFVFGQLFASLLIWLTSKRMFSKKESP
ncbi:MAG: hypothetical protein LBK67_02590, partial [Coriobacteriales bacterium]|nr:hypothetical protein [Coriobacteriales bacterium]